jgi:hypothetical protein
MPARCIRMLPKNAVYCVHTAAHAAVTRCCFCYCSGISFVVVSVPHLQL